MKKYEPSEELQARAYCKAYLEGKIGTHFVVISEHHLKDLKKREVIGLKDGEWVKLSTGRPIWRAYIRTKTSK